VDHLPLLSLISFYSWCLFTACDCKWEGVSRKVVCVSIVMAGVLVSPSLYISISNIFPLNNRLIMMKNPVCERKREIMRRMVKMTNYSSLFPAPKRPFFFCAILLTRSATFFLKLLWALNTGEKTMTCGVERRLIVRGRSTASLRKIQIGKSCQGNTDHSSHFSLSRDRTFSL